MNLQKVYEDKLKEVENGEKDQRSLDAWLDVVEIKHGFKPKVKKTKAKVKEDVESIEEDKEV